MFLNSFIANSKYLNIKLCILLVICGQLLFGQDQNLKTYFNIHLGTNINDSRVQHIINSPIQGFELGITKETFGNNEWEQVYHYPEYGLSLFYTTLGNNKIFGHEISLVPFFKLNLFSWNKLSCLMRIGLGLSYLNTTYNPITNPKNPATSSHFNFHTNLRGVFTYKLNNRLELNNGVSFDHTSNGNLNKPNLGLNNLTVYTGLSYLLNEKIEKKTLAIPLFIPSNKFLVFLNFGGKKNNYSNSYYLTTSLSMELRRTFSRVISLGIGGDFFIDNSIQSSFMYLNKEYHKSDSFQTGIFISQSMTYNNVTVTFQEGAYIILREKVNQNNFYTKAIIQYNFYKKFSTRLALKSHQFNVLDYPEIGLGYEF